MTPVSDIRPLAPDEAGLIGSIIGKAFADDPVNMWVFGNNDALIPFYRATAKKLCLKHGISHVNRDHTAGSLWLPPGASKDIPMWKSLGIFTNIIRYGGMTAIKRGLTINSLMKTKTPAFPHYYLLAIGTLTEARGTGQGKAIMNHALAQIDKAKMPAYLENSKPENIGFYQSFGFDIIEEIRPAPDAPPDPIKSFQQSKLFATRSKM